MLLPGSVLLGCGGASAGVPDIPGVGGKAAPYLQVRTPEQPVPAPRMWGRSLLFTLGLWAECLLPCHQLRRGQPKDPPCSDAKRSLPPSSTVCNSQKDLTLSLK